MVVVMRRLPILAITLGVLGLIPFLACTAGIVLFPADLPAPNLVRAIIAYGAIILAFLGGVHWGFALEPAPPLATSGQHVPDRKPGPLDSKRLALGVLPSLIGWAALLVSYASSTLLAIILLILGFLGTTLVEAQAQRQGALPPGYMALRWMLSLVVLFCLVVVVLVRTF